MLLGFTGGFLPEMVAAVMAMAISYNWLFQWDYTFYKWGDFLVLRTGISGHNCGINIRKKIFGFRIFARETLW